MENPPIKGPLRCPWHEGEVNPDSLSTNTMDCLLHKARATNPPPASHRGGSNPRPWEAGVTPPQCLPLSYTPVGSLRDNKFYRELSWDWNKYPKLTTLSLSNNNISGRIPIGLGEASQLHRIYLSSNHLEGSIPTSLANLTLLLYRNLDDNKLSGKILVEFG